MDYTCKECGRILPEADFYKSKGKVTNKTCKVCIKKKYREDSEGKVTRRNHTSGNTGYKVCAECGKEYPLSEYGQKRILNKETMKSYVVYDSYCKECNRILSKERMRKKRTSE